MTSQQNDQRSGSINPLMCFAFLCRTFAVSVEVFLHRKFGERYLGLQSAAVVLLIPLYSLAWPGHDLRPLLGFLAGYLAMCLFASIGVGVRKLLGVHLHSFYSGEPRLLRFINRKSERTVKRFLEPLIVFAAGIFISSLNEPLGSYLLFASFGLLASVQVAVDHDRRLAIDMHDAYLDQQQTMDRFRTMRGERS